MARSYLLDGFGLEMTNQRLANGCELRGNTPSHPDIHLDETRRLNALDIDGITMVEDGQMRSQPCSLDDVPQVWERDFTQCHSLHRLSPKTEHADAECMLTAFRITADIAARSERTQKITCGTLGHAGQAAD